MGYTRRNKNGRDLHACDSFGMVAIFLPVFFLLFWLQNQPPAKKQKRNEKDDDVIAASSPLDDADKVRYMAGDICNIIMLYTPLL